MKLFALALGAVVGGAVIGSAATAAPRSAASTGAAWNDYVYVGDEFAISAPVAPKFEEQTVAAFGGSTEAHIYTMLAGDEGAFMVLVMTRQAADQRSDQQVLDEARVGALRAANAIVIVQSNVAVGPHHGSQIDLQSQNAAASGNSSRMRDRFFIVGRRFYQLMSIAPAGEPLPADTDRWFDSFRLVGEGTR